MRNKIIIYGAGNFSRKIKNNLEKNNFIISYFIDADKNKIGTDIDDVPIISLYDSKLTESVKNEIMCVIGIFNREINLFEIEKLLIQSGFKRIINPIKFYKDFAIDIDDTFWLTNIEKKNQDDIIKNVEKLWDDDCSRKLFNSILEYRETGNLEVLQLPNNISEQYFPEDIDFRLSHLNFIDCGAFTGDTIKQIIKKNITVNSIVAFEPCMSNFNELSSFIQKTNLNCFLFPCAVWDKFEILHFSAGCGESSCIDESANSFVSGISIDEILPNYHANYIKMDLEGSETNALGGAEKIIKKCRPKLAISVYHKHNDIFEIPNLINSWELGYKFYLRMYGYNAFDLVLYAKAD